MPPNALDPEDFVAHLKSGDLDVSTPLTLIGMVKEAGDFKHLLFASGTDCSTWIELPLSIIENVEVQDVVPCRDHTHPLVKLRLKEPSSEEARAFASLAKALSRVHPSQGPSEGQAPGYSSALRLAERWMEAETARGNVTPTKDTCLACFKAAREEGLDFFQTVNKCFPQCPG